MKLQLNDFRDSADEGDEEQQVEGFVVVEAVVEADDVEHGFIGVNVEIGPELHDIDDWV